MIATIINAVFAVVGQLETMCIFTDFPEVSILKMLVAFAVTAMVFSLFLAGKPRTAVFL